jgi:membrane associated rhomboid family serine protease
VGIYDRDYYRQEQRTGPLPYLPRTVVGWIIVLNVAVWMADLFSSPTLVTRDGDVLGRWLSDFLAAHVDTLTHPLYWWQFLTAGFAHAPGLQHILFNMLALFFLGRDVEELYGPKEFLRLYLAMLVFANVIWSVVSTASGAQGGVYGASGAIAGIVVLYALNFPNRTLLLFFAIPMPAWLAGVLVVAYDIYGATVGVAGSNVAFSVHVAGAAFALIYFKQRWNLTRFTEGRFRWPRLPFGGRPRLRVRRPEDEPEEDPNADLSREVDQILEKIGRAGEAALTPQERRTLETASRQYRRRMTKHE